MVLHLGLPRWHYAYTEVGLDPVAKQWFRALAPDRLAVALADTDQTKRDPAPVPQAASSAPTPPLARPTSAGLRPASPSAAPPGSPRQSSPAPPLARAAAKSGTRRKNVPAARERAHSRELHT
jgi:hypothetical protein